MTTRQLLERFAHKHQIPLAELRKLSQRLIANEIADNKRLLRNLAVVYKHFANIDDPLVKPEDVIRVASERQQVYFEESMIDLVGFHLEACQN